MEDATGLSKGGSPDSASKPRKSLSLACEGCRKKKVRCSGEPGPCTSCVQSNTTCHFSGYVKPRRTPVRSSRRITALEQRLDNIEELLREQRQPPAARTRTTTPPAKPAPVQTPTQAAWYPLPQLEEAMSHAKRYFAIANKMFPIFEESLIMPPMRIEYESLTPGFGAIWSSVNVILALAHQQQAAYLSQDGPTHQVKALRYLENALRAIDDFASPRQPCILTAQCLLGIAEVYRASPTPQKSSMYIAMAVRQFYHIGLHRQTPTIWTDTLQNLVCFRLYWTTYCIDRDVSLRLDHPPMLENDPKALKPGESSPGSPQTDEAKHFGRLVDLAMIQDYTFQQVNRARDQTRTDESQKMVACEIAVSLGNWLLATQVDFTPSSLSKYSPPEAMQMVVLYARYFTTLTTAHRLAYWSVEEMDVYKSSFDNVVLSSCPSQAVCVSAARKLLALFPMLPHGNVPYQWLLIDHFVSAAVILLAGIIYKARFSLGRRDFELVRPIVAEIEVLKLHGDTDRLQYLGQNCTELSKVAANVLDAAALDTSAETLPTRIM